MAGRSAVLGLGGGDGEGRGATRGKLPWGGEQVERCICARLGLSGDAAAAGEAGLGSEGDEDGCGCGCGCSGDCGFADGSVGCCCGGGEELTGESALSGRVSLRGGRAGQSPVSAEPSTTTALGGRDVEDRASARLGREHGRTTQGASGASPPRAGTGGAAGGGRRRESSSTMAAPAAAVLRAWRGSDHTGTAGRGSGAGRRLGVAAGLTSRFCFS